MLAWVDEELGTGCHGCPPGGGVGQLSMAHQGGGASFNGIDGHHKGDCKGGNLRLNQ